MDIYLKKLYSIFLERFSIAKQIIITVGESNYITIIDVNKQFDHLLLDAINTLRNNIKQSNKKNYHGHTWKQAS